VTARDVVIIGAGHNGLVTACYLARAGIKSVVLERRGVVGGIGVTEPAEDGFHFSTLAHDTGPFSARVLRELGLEKRGLGWLMPSVRVFAPANSGPPVILYRNVTRTAAAIGFFSPADARRYPDFAAAFERLGRVLKPLLESLPPDIDHPTAGDVLGMLGFAAVPQAAEAGRAPAAALGAMAVADLAAEWFENETLRAVVAARGIFGAAAGPWSAGTSLPLLLQSALGGDGLWQACFVRGGIGALARALGDLAQSLGVQVRTDAEVARIIVKEGRATGVVLENGEEIEARAVVSSVDPRSTFLRLVDPADLAPSFLTKVRNYRSNGTLAKVNLALSELPTFGAVRDSGLPDTEALAGHIQIGPEIDYSSGPSTRPSTEISRSNPISTSPFPRSPSPRSRRRATT
jgi:phytoene dehydrogenase-like protein